jgi:ribosome modulation factor
MMDKEQMLELARDEGYEAECEGVPRDRNPYVRLINPLDWQGWNEGWDEARRKLEEKP